MRTCRLGALLVALCCFGCGEPALTEHHRAFLRDIFTRLSMPQPERIEADRDGSLLLVYRIDGPSGTARQDLQPRARDILDVVLVMRWQGFHYYRIAFEGVLGSRPIRWGSMSFAYTDNQQFLDTNALFDAAYQYVWEPGRFLDH